MVLSVSCDNSLNVSEIDTVNSYIENTENQHLENDVINEIATDENENIPLKTRNYEGYISNVDIHMTLNYYADGVVEGVYLYDKYKQETPIYGIEENDRIILSNDELEEIFEGVIYSGYISGDWHNNDNEYKFMLWNIDNDEYQSQILPVQSDNDYIYFIGKDTAGYNISKANLDFSNIVKLYEFNGYAEPFFLYCDYIYFINEKNCLYRMDLDGNNQEIIVDASVVNYNVYKDRIYYTSNDSDQYSPINYEDVYSVNMLGDDLKTIKLPQYCYFDGYPKKYWMDFIYNDYIYFHTTYAGTNDASFVYDFYICRIKIDGTNAKEFGFSGEPISGIANSVIGCIDNMLFIENDPKIEKVNINIDDDTLVTISERIENDGYRTSITNNGEYIASLCNYTNADFCEIIISDINGNIVNEVKVNKSDLPDYCDITILNDYIYLIGSPDNDIVGRLAISTSEMEFMR